VSSAFKIEHVRRVPRGYKVRTTFAGPHQIRIAYPPGPRRRGSGEVVEILHPRGENPSCELTRARAEEIARKFSASRRNAGGRTARRNKLGKTYEIVEIDAGDKARVLSSGLARAVAKQKLQTLRSSYGQHGLRFIMRREQENPRRKKNAAELVIFNPSRKHRGTTRSLKSRRRQVTTNINGGRRRRLNPDEMQEAMQLYEQFHGADPSKILEVQESAAVRDTYAGLGDLVELLVKAPSGKTVQMSFDGDRVKVAANPKGTQIYFIGGNQNLNGALEEFGADTSKDFVELGEAKAIVYFTRKEADGMQPIEYKHEFGEEGGSRPVLVYNKIQRRMILVGGDYTVEAPGIIN
jgi:hypothetical protein